MNIENQYIEKDKKIDTILFKMWIDYLNHRADPDNDRICLKCMILPITMCACAFKNFSQNITSSDIEKFKISYQKELEAIKIITDKIRKSKEKRKRGMIQRLNLLKEDVKKICKKDN